MTRWSSPVRWVGHLAHASRLARFEESLVVRRDPSATLPASIAGCTMCEAEAARLAGVAARINRAAAVLDLGVAPSGSVRDRVRAAALGATGATPRTGPAWRSVWTGLGAVGGALALALALTLSDALPAAASFRLTGSDLAPGSTGVAEVRPLDGGSVSMRLDIRDLPASRPGEFYELWWVGPDKRHVSCGTFRSDGSPLDLTFTAAVDLEKTVLMEITLERDDGDTTPGPHVAQ